MFFKKKIIVTEEMKQTLQSFDEISWASCCGIPYKKRIVLSVYSRNLASQCGDAGFAMSKIRVKISN